MKNLLVTGGAGFIGSNFVRYILGQRSDLKAVTFDTLTYAGSLENLRDLPNPEHHTFAQGDICNGELVASLLREHAIDTIVHFAAETHVDRSINSPKIFAETNVLGTLALLEGARARGGVRFHHISTDEVYGSLEPKDPAFTEQTPYSPNSPYAASKAASDHLVRAYEKTYGLPITISNCSNNYGPYQYPEKLIPLAILNALQGKPIPVYGDGLQVRDWLHVLDHCRAIELIFEKGRIGETYNLGGSVQATNLEIVEQICAILDKEKPAGKPHKSLMEFVKDRPGHDRRYAMDIHKVQKELGWRPKYSLQDGLQETISWYIDHMDWVEKIQQKENYREWVASHYGKQGMQT